MRNIINILFLLTIVHVYCLGENTKEYQVLLNRADFTVCIDEDLAYITSDNYICEYGGNTSEPALPYIRVNILIGFNDVFDSFTYSANEQIIANDISIINNSIEIPTNNMQNNPTCNPIIAYKEDSYPKKRIKYSGTHDADGYKYISFLISPFRYDNLNRSLYFATNFSIIVNTNESVKNKRRNYHFRFSQDRIKKIVINYDDVPLLYPLERDTLSFYPRTGVQYDYIIITNNNLKPAFMKLADWKTKKGIRTNVLTTEEIYDTYSGPPATNQQMIKAALYYYYDNCPNLRFALLGGDVDVVPAQMCVVRYIPNDTTYYGKNCPVDLYYSNFSTMNWDGNNNGINGELDDSCSITPQIAITRAPVSTINDAEIFVNRIIQYEVCPNIDNWSNNILMCGNKLNVYYEVNGDFISDAHYKGERIFNEIIHNYWSGSKKSFYDTGTDFSGGANYDFKSNNIQSQLSNGYTFVNVSTHGTPTYWTTESSAYSVSHAETLNNSNHTIIITTACHTNAFDSIPKCLSEAFIRNPNSGIVSYFGCSRQGWSNKSQYNYGSSNNVNIELYRKMFSGNDKSFGEIVRKTKEVFVPHCGNYSTPYRWLLFGLNPIGDAEMPIYVDTPQKFTNVSIAFINGTLSVDTGVSDCKISVVSANDMGASYYDVRNGMTATFTNLTEEYSICITKTGYVPYLAACGNTVYLQNENIISDYKIISNQTVAGSNVTNNKPNGPVKINKGKTIINSNSGVIIENNFEVEYGASFEIR